MSTTHDTIELPTGIARDEQGTATRVLRYMVNHAGDHDGNTTALAEDAAHNALEVDHDEWLDDETHWLWDLALLVIPGD